MKKQKSECGRSAKKPVKVKELLKKAVVLTLASVLTVSAVPVEWTTGGEVQAEESEEKVYGDFKYTVLEDGTVEISKYTGEGGDVIIPDSIEGKMVSGIGECAFMSKNIISVECPSGLKIIRMNAFFDCENLTTVVLPEGLTEIGSYAFGYCKELTNINIPDSVQSIASFAFNWCESLENICVPADSLAWTYNVFAGCTNLKDISVNQGNGGIISEDGVLYEIYGNNKILYCYPAGKSDKIFSIPEGVTGIGGKAFVSCKNLQSVHIPESMANIELTINDRMEGCFSDCDNIENFSVHENNPIFYTINGVLCRYFSDDQNEIFRYPSGKKDKTYVIPEEITRIGGASFAGCKNLEGVSMAEGLQEIDLRAFYSCSGLLDIVIPENVKIRSLYFVGTFEECTSLQHIVLPSSLEKIHEYMFRGCSSLTSIDIPDNVKTIEMSAFEGCTGLENIHLPQSLTVISGGAFDGCSSLEVIQLPEGLQEIEWEAFKNCERLSSIRIPDSVIKIGNEALGYIWSSEKIEGFRIFGGEGTEAQRYAEENGFLFNDQEEETPDDSEISTPTEADTDNQQQGNQSVTQQVQNTPVQNAVTVGTTLTDSGKKATYTVTSVTSKGGTVTYVKPISAVSKLTIPSTVTVEGKTYQVTAISANAFKGQKKLKTLTIPASVTKIGNYAFKNCKNLKKLIIKSKKLTKKSLGKKAFKGLTKKTAVQVPKKKLKAYKKLLKQCGLSVSAAVERI